VVNGRYRDSRTLTLTANGTDWLQNHDSMENHFSTGGELFFQSFTLSATPSSRWVSYAVVGNQQGGGILTASTTAERSQRDVPVLTLS
jgi:hypothetical protein